MPISFTAIPLHIQQQIVAKLPLKDLASFQEASQKSQMIAKRSRNVFKVSGYIDDVEFSWSNQEILVRFNRKGLLKLQELPTLQFHAGVVKIDEEFTQEFCEKLTAFFCKSGSSIWVLEMLDKKDLCSPSSFREFLDLAAVEYLKIEGPIPDVYTDVLFASTEKSE